MNSKNLAKRLERLGYTVIRDYRFGWAVVSVYTGFEWRFENLSGVKVFTVDEENLGKIVA